VNMEETALDLSKKLRLIAMMFTYEGVTSSQAKSAEPYLNNAVAAIEGLMREMSMPQQAILKHCGRCGWNTMVPGYGCLNCMKRARLSLDRCPKCGGEDGNGHDRCYPPSSYLYIKCT